MVQPAHADDLSIVLDTFEAKCRAHLARFDTRRYTERRDVLRDVLDREEPIRSGITAKPGLDYYDGYRESHGQD